jgi:hypothetical protein
MRTLHRSWAVALSLAIASASLPALAQKAHAMKGRIEQIDLAARHIVVQEIHGLKHRQPLALGDHSKIELASGPGTLEQIHVGDEVSVSFEPSPTGQQVVDLRVTRPVGS